MPTNKQIQVVKYKLTEKNITDGEIVRRSGYSESMARQSTRVMNSRGVQELLAQASEGSEWLSPQGIRKCIERAVKSEYNKSKADTILKFYQLQIQSQAKTQLQDNRSITIQNPNPEVIDDQAHKYISRKYDIPLNYLRAYLREYTTKSERENRKS